MQTDLFIVLFVFGVCIFYVLVLMSGRAGSGKDFYTSQSGVSPLARGMGLAADWLCAATLVSLFGLFTRNPEEAQWMLTGWLIGLLLLSVVVAPAVYDSGQLSAIDLIAQHFNSVSLRWLMAVIMLVMGVILLSLQLKGLGLILSRHLQLPLSAAIAIGVLLLFFYTILSNLKAITRVQMLKYCIIFSAVIVSSVYIASDSQFPDQWTFLQSLLTAPSFNESHSSTSLLSLSADKTPLEIIFTLIVLAAGTALLPYMLKRFQGVKLKADIRFSAIWMFLFIGVVYSSLPWMTGQANEKLSQVVHGPLQEGGAYSRMPNWLFLWEYTREISWEDKNNDGRIQWIIEPVSWSDELGPETETPDNFVYELNASMHTQTDQHSDGSNEFWISDEVRLLLLPELFEMPDWVVALVTIGITAALISTASMVLVSTVSVLVSQPAVDGFTARNESVVIKGLATLMLIVAASVSMNLSGNLIDWFSLVLQIAAASLFPAFIFAMTASQLPKVCVFAGMIIGLLATLGYAVVYETYTFSGLSPLPMTVVWMLLNAITVLMLAWFIYMRTVRVTAKSDSTC